MIASFAVSTLAFTFLAPRFAADDPNADRGGHAGHGGGEHRGLAGGDVCHARPSPTRARLLLPARPARRAGLGTGLASGSASAASRSRAARWPGPTGSPASSPSTPRSSVSASSSSPRRPWGSPCWWSRPPPSTGSRARFAPSSASRSRRRGERIHDAFASGASPASRRPQWEPQPEARRPAGDRGERIHDAFASGASARRSLNALAAGARPLLSCGGFHGPHRSFSGGDTHAQGHDPRVSGRHCSHRGLHPARPPIPTAR